MKIREHALRHYGFAILMAISGLLLSLLLQPLTRESNFLLFVAAVMISAWYGGLGAGLFTTALAVLAGSYYLLSPMYALNLADANNVVHLALFIFVAVLISSLNQKVRSAQRQAEALAHDREAVLLREKEARVEAEAATRARDEFLAMVSHELRTPITAILGWSEMLRRLPVSDQTSQAEALGAIERNARTQSHLINDLLDSSRIIAGKLYLDMQLVDLSTVIHAALDVVCQAADAKQIQVQVLLDPKAGLVSGDANRLQQVMWNLLSNAIKFTPCGGLIKVHLKRVNSRLEVTVSDTGKGVRPEFLPHVFERFSQFGGASTHGLGGLGLGLAIARQVVELHGGTIEAESPGEGLGSTFRIKLPICIITNNWNEPEPQPLIDNNKENKCNLLVASEP